MLRAGSLIEVTRDEAVDLLSRGKAEPHTLDPKGDDTDADQVDDAANDLTQDAQDATAGADTSNKATTTDAAQAQAQDDSRKLHHADRARRR